MLTSITDKNTEFEEGTTTLCRSVANLLPSDAALRPREPIPYPARCENSKTIGH